MKKLTFLTFAILCIAGTTVQAAPMAFWDFGTDPGKDNLDDFTLITSASVSLTADNVQFQNDSRQNRGIRTEISDLAVANKQDFTIQATLGTSFNNVFQRFGLTLYADASISDPLATGISFALYSNDDSSIDIRVYDNSIGGSTVTDPWAGHSRGTVNAQALDYTVTGTWIGDDLDFEFTVSYLSGTNTISKTLTHTVENAAFSGNYFGIGGRISDNAVFTADTLTVIPEPSQFALMALGLLAVALGARRRKRG